MIEYLAWYLVITSCLAHCYFVTPLILRTVMFCQRWAYLWVFILRITVDEVEPLTKYKFWQIRTIKTAFKWARMFEPNSRLIFMNDEGEMVSNRFGFLRFKPTA